MNVRSAALSSALRADISNTCGYDIGLLPSCSLDGWPGMSYEDQCAIALWDFHRKRLADEANPKADQAALKTFISSNEKCRDWSLPANLQEYEAILLGEFEETIHRFFRLSGEDSLFRSYGDIYLRGRTGPGASVAARGTDLYTKLFDSPVSCTSEDIYYIYKFHCDGDFRWADAEMLRSKSHSHLVVKGSNLSFVPKNEKSSRTICTEPSLNMFFQLGIGTIMTERLKSYFGLDLSNQQEVNGWLAREGSITGAFATIDLSSASDSVSLGMVRRFFPKEVVALLEQFRSPSTKLPSGRFCDLHMLSSMGNGFTFPLQTVIFASIVRAVYRVLDIPFLRNRRDRDVLDEYDNSCNFGVFGDDIIVTKDAFRLTLRLLELLGFTPNPRKTFSEGPFRESCGFDWFHGQPCRGVLVKSLIQEHQIHAAINRYINFTALTGFGLPRTVQYLTDLLKVKRFIPPHEDESAGIRVPLKYHACLPKRGPHGVFVYHPIKPVSLKLRIREGAVWSPKMMSRRSHNWAGLYLAFLHGSLRCNAIVPKQDHGLWRASRCVTPSWHYVPKGRGLMPPTRSWEAAALYNLP